ncbi:PP2C family protein-serine/threonine phosphatase [Candidatus Frankia nodulisporulans]|uniref:PP2C family protein-serine/threonine phosphatase n=1 Tax=Candidatus Frankia nodulisporulans TaxID=2060052 RepID=UPI001CDD859A|nr:PP2C family protein-serine/threonine phosphatase [Candidatus Frankia nodulisporulans]
MTACSSRNGGGPAAQAVRLGGVALGGVLAVLASRYNTRRETKLANVSRVAEVAQQSILTPLAPSAGPLRLAVRYASATAEARVGGDLYEVLDTPRGTRLIIGDVRGKGLDAVRVASRVLGCFRLAARQVDDLFDLLTALDAEAATVCGLDDFVTAVVGQVDDDRLTLVNAGHPDPLLVRAGRVRPMEVAIRLPPLALLAGANNEVTIMLRPGDRMLFYTDGVSEARHPATGEFFPLQAQVEAAFAGRGGRDLDDALADLAQRVRAWTHDTLSDDVALLAVELAPAPPGPPGPPRPSAPSAPSGPSGPS